MPSHSPILALPARRDDLERLAPIAARLRGDFADLVVLGTGGSSLGAQALEQGAADRGLPGPDLTRQEQEALVSSDAVHQRREALLVGVGEPQEPVAALDWMEDVAPGGDLNVTVYRQGRKEKLHATKPAK